MIYLIVRPRVTKTWKQFCEETPHFSIALDGYVADGPKFEPLSMHANFNHHEMVNRLATRSTTGQIFLALKQGLPKVFSADGEFFANVYVNDPDQDVATSVWLLRNYQRVMKNKSEPLITRFISVVDLLDTTGGLFPLDPELDIRKEIAWIFEPYTEFRKAGTLQKLNAQEMSALIEVVCGRISDYSLGKGKKIILDTRYEKLHPGYGWAMVKEIGMEARAQFVNDGINAFVSVQERPDGSWNYTLARTAEFVSFPIPLLCRALNTAEGLEESSSKWGGGDTIGGSPREGGSRLSPKEVIELIEKFYEYSKYGRYP